MKKTIKSISVLFTVFCGLTFTSCSTDDSNIVDPGGNPDPVNSELKGNVDQDITLDPTVAYKLTGQLNVLSGTKLTIPAGTKITANAGAEIYIAIQKGAEIAVNGTRSNPVIMTSTNGAAGDWGGLLLLGEGLTTSGIDAIAEVGGFIYGGTDNTDNSGSINYLVIEGAGAQINAKSQYNGLTLYAVGSRTSINNVALINGADDGVEFFGGAVSVTNLYLENNEDDAIDWTEGWSGTVTNAYSLHTIEGFSTAVEADGVNNNPKLVNFTSVSTTGGTALQFKIESGATITGLSLTGYDTSVDMKDSGSLANVILDGAAANPELSYT
ncbi:MAG: hypothetical protein JJE07_10790, partial [Flavobacteriaceae bacterium]|nr:hypothetical protein [Flavobacteriaceae bacterium]